MDAEAATPSRAASLPLVGSDLAFDFTNTASGRDTPLYQDHLHAPEHIIAWSRHAKVLTPEDGVAIGRMIAGKPSLGRDLLARARQLREVIYRIALPLRMANCRRPAIPTLSLASMPSASRALG